MTTLPYDIQRCTGVIIGSDNLRCKQRESCRRYIEWDKWLRSPNPEFGISAGPAVPACKQKIEVSND